MLDGCNLISHQLQALLLMQITRAFDKAVSKKDSNDNKEVILKLPVLGTATCRTVWILSSLLRAAVVIVSNWEDHGDIQCTPNCSTTDEYFTRLLAYLIIPPEPSTHDSDLGKKSISGLASALNEHDRTPAASIEDVSVLIGLIVALLRYFSPNIFSVGLSCKSKVLHSCKACSTIGARYIFATVASLLRHV